MRGVVASGVRRCDQDEGAARRSLHRRGQNEGILKIQRCARFAHSRRFLVYYKCSLGECVSES